jgi:hypothetical protein
MLVAMCHVRPRHSHLPSVGNRLGCTSESQAAPQPAIPPTKAHWQPWAAMKAQAPAWCQNLRLATPARQTCATRTSSGGGGTRVARVYCRGVRWIVGPSRRRSKMGSLEPAGGSRHLPYQCSSCQACRRGTTSIAGQLASRRRTTAPTRGASSFQGEGETMLMTSLCMMFGQGDERGSLTIPSGGLWVKQNRWQVRLEARGLAKISLGF